MPHQPSTDGAESRLVTRGRALSEAGALRTGRAPVSPVIRAAALWQTGSLLPRRRSDRRPLLWCPRSGPDRRWVALPDRAATAAIGMSLPERLASTHRLKSASTSLGDGFAHRLGGPSCPVTFRGGRARGKCGALSPGGGLALARAGRGTQSPAPAERPARGLGHRGEPRGPEREPHRRGRPDHRRCPPGVRLRREVLGGPGRESDDPTWSAVSRPIY